MAVDLQTRTDPVDGRNETPLERCDRNLAELLQELRVVQTGVQVLFAFLLTVPFSARFETLSAGQRDLFFVTLLLNGLAAILLIAPTSWHRLVFRQGDKEHLLWVANRFALAGLACVALGMVGVVTLIADVLYGTSTVAAATAGAAIGCLLLWFVLPALRRRRIS